MLPPLTWHVKTGNTSIINSIPERFVIAELVAEKERIIAVHDNLTGSSTECYSVIEAMLLAKETYQATSTPRNFMEQPD